MLNLGSEYMAFDAVSLYLLCYFLNPKKISKSNLPIQLLDSHRSYAFSREFKRNVVYNFVIKQSGSVFPFQNLLN